MDLETYQKTIAKGEKALVKLAQHIDRVRALRAKKPRGKVKRELDQLLLDCLIAERMLREDLDQWGPEALLGQLIETAFDPDATGPEVEALQHWVFHDVLPCIRRYGCYPQPPVGADQSMHTPDHAGAAMFEKVEKFFAQPGNSLISDIELAQLVGLDIQEVKDIIAKHPEEFPRQHIHPESGGKPN